MSTDPLRPDMSNKADFVNSMFAPAVRDPDQDGLPAAIAGGATMFPYADPTSRGYILGAWLAAWQASVGDPSDPVALARCPQQDRRLIEFFAGYLVANALDLCVPALTYDHTNAAGLAVYRDAGYQRQAFRSGGAWVYGAFDASGEIVGDPADATVARFLQLVFYGAHIVTISSSKDGAVGVQDMKDALGRSGLPTTTDPVNSHYGGSGVLSGTYYAPVGGPNTGLRDNETLSPTVPPGGEPLAFSLLVGVTASTHRNTFLQLEGWPAQVVVSPPGGARHNADYAANEATLWNFATYGACVHSEKRSTPIFLAGSSFDLTLRADTGMPWYWGANAGNAGDPWMHPELVILGA